MKKLVHIVIITVVCVLSFTTILTSCASTSQAKEEVSDAYITAEKGEESTEIAVEKKDKDNTSFFKRWYNKDIPPVELTESSIFLFGGIGLTVEQHDVSYLYYPSQDEVCMKYAILTGKTYIYFNKVMRDALKKAYENYLSDFENKCLTKKNKNSYKIYDELIGDFCWGFTGPANRTKPKTSIGYTFVKKSPYFTITFWPAKTYTNVQEFNTDAERSSKTTIMMTKKQAADLIAQFDEDALQELFQNAIPETQQADEYVGDEYSEQ